MADDELRTPELLRKASNHSVVWMSRWFVGSSRKRTSTPSSPTSCRASASLASPSGQGGHGKIHWVLIQPQSFEDGLRNAQHIGPTRGSECLLLRLHSGP